MPSDDDRRNEEEILFDESTSTNEIVAAERGDRVVEIAESGDDDDDDSLHIINIERRLSYIHHSAEKPYDSPVCRCTGAGRGTLSSQSLHKMASCVGARTPHIIVRFT